MGFLFSTLVLMYFVSVPDPRMSDVIETVRALCKGRGITERVIGLKHYSHCRPWVRFSICGDSLAKALTINLGNGTLLSNLAKGGAVAHDFLGTKQYQEVMSFRPEAILIWLGSNDVCRNDGDRFMRDILNLVLHFEQQGKVTFVLGLPNRFQKHTYGGKFRIVSHVDYAEFTLHVNKQLLNVLGRRFITLPDDCYHPEAYKSSDGVHFTDLVNLQIGSKVREHLLSYLTSP